MLYNDNNLPFAGYKDFSACLAAQRKKGKTPESAKKICGALQARAEGSTANAAQIPQEVKPHYNRSVKALDFLKQEGLLVDDDENNDNNTAESYDTSLDNQSPKPTQLNNIMYSDPESYSDKITRFMDEYKISEEEAKSIVNEIIQTEMKELDRREYELTKQAKIEQAQAGMITSEEAAEPTIQKEPEEQEQEQDVNNNTTDGEQQPTE